MKRIDWLVVGYYSLIGAVCLFYVVVFAWLICTPSVRSSDPITSEAWRQIAIRQQVRASVAEMYLRRCQDAPMTPIKCPSDQTDGELQSRAHVGEPQGIDPMRGNPSSSALASEDEPAGNRSEIAEDGPEREPVTADTKGQPSNDEASIALYERLSDRAKEGRWTPTTAADNVNVRTAIVLARAKRMKQHASSAPSGITLNSAATSSRMSRSTTALTGDDLPAGGKGEAWNSSNAGVKELQAYGVTESPMALTAFAPSVESSISEAANLTTASSPIPCGLPIKIRTDGKLAESCEVNQSGSLMDGKETKWTTSQSTTAPALTPTASAITTSPLRVQSAGIVSAAPTSSLTTMAVRREPSAKPETPVVCLSDALGPVTTLWNKVSVDWYRASLAYPRDKQLPWLFQCRGDLAQLAAADAAKDPAAAADLMAWLLTWLFDHGVISRESYAWHHVTVVRPQEAAGVTEVTVRFDVWESHGEIDRDGMNGEVLADPDCEQCEVWYWAPMVPGTASVVKWGGR